MKAHIKALGKWLYKCISSTYGVTNQSQYNCKAGRDWREDGDPDVPVPS